MFLELIAHIEKEFHRMTQAIKDLTDAVQANTDATNAAVAAILNNTGTPVDPEDAPGLAAAVSAVTANTRALTTALGGVVVAPPTGTPVSAADRQAALNAGR